MWRRLWILNFLKIIVRLKKQLSVRPVTPSRNHRHGKGETENEIYVWSEIYYIDRVIPPHPLSETEVNYWYL